MVTLMIFVSAYSQEDMVIINSDGFDRPQRPPTVFRMMNTMKRLKLKSAMNVIMFTMMTAIWWKMSRLKTSYARIVMN
jgi:hypothetical protein